MTSLQEIQSKPKMEITVAKCIWCKKVIEGTSDTFDGTCGSVSLHSDCLVKASIEGFVY